MVIVSEQFINCIYTHLLIQKTREGMAIVSVHAYTLYLLIKQIRKGVAIVSGTMHAYVLHLLIKQIREGVAIVSVQCMHILHLLNR